MTAPPHRFVVLVTGGRSYGDAALLRSELDRVHNDGVPRFITDIVHGACGWDADKPDEDIDRLRGADRFAHIWALRNDVPVHTCPAHWTTRGRPAGMIRNGQMLKRYRPDLVLATVGGPGTAGMVKLARRALVDVLRTTDCCETIDCVNPKRWEGLCETHFAEREVSHGRG